MDQPTQHNSSKQVSMNSITGIIVSTRYTAYQIKLKLEGGREVALWKRKFACQWGGRRNCNSELQQELCDAEGDYTVPILAPGVSVTLIRDSSQNGNEGGARASIFCVLSVCVPPCTDLARYRSYSAAVSSWVCSASRNLLIKAELRLVPEHVAAQMQIQIQMQIQMHELEDEGTAWEKECSCTATQVVKEAISLIRAAVNRVNIRATLENDTREFQGCQKVSSTEIDTLSAAMDSYESFRHNPFEARMGGGKKPLLRTLDTFAEAYGLSESTRCIAAVAFKMRTMLADGGHACCSPSDLMSTPPLAWSTDAVRRAIIEGVRLGVFIADSSTGEDVYLAHIHRTEVGVASLVARLARGGEVGAWATRINDAENLAATKEIVERDELCQQLDPVQRGAVLSALTSPRDVLVLSGYPGTGKSRVCQAVCSVCKLMGLTVIVCAPTAKAASRLGDGATTVHRALGAVPRVSGKAERNDNGCSKDSSGQQQGGAFRFSRNSMQPLDADLILVDEVSMLDMNLAHALLRACDLQRTRLLLVGDAHQLPSVEWGDFLGALMSSSSVPHVFLERIYRQDTCNNTIWPLAKSIAEGGPLLRSDLRSDSVTWITDDSLSGVSAALLLLRLEHGDKLQIISPSRRHGLHTGVLNEVILDRQVTRWDLRFEVGDRVVVVRNQPHPVGRVDKTIPFMNGDCGKIISLGSGPAESKRVFLRLDNDRIGHVSPMDIEHSYALTIHKAQGSEYDFVAVVMSAQQGRALNRQALYTSVSRAVKRLYIFASRETLCTCVSNMSEQRFGHLQERIDGQL